MVDAFALFSQDNYTPFHRLGTQIIQILHQIMEKEFREEVNFIKSSEQLSPEQQKIQLITYNTILLRKMLSTSVKTGIFRLFLFLVVIVFEQRFILTTKDQNLPDSWSIIFYVIACMMDFLGILNDTSLMKFLTKEEQVLQKVKEELANHKEVTAETRIGHYTTYLSIYQTIKKYKYQTMPAASISETVRYLHIILTFYIFCNLALDVSNIVQGQTFKIVFLQVFILSIYFNIFQLDLLTMEGSEGPFLEQKQPSQQNKPNITQCDEILNKTLKNRFIKTCRRPFEVIYLINIIIMFTFIVLQLEMSPLNIMMGIGIALHILELVHEKHLQNKLVDFNLTQLPYKHLSCCKIMYQLFKDNRAVYLAIRVSVRISDILIIMAYFRQQNPSLERSLIFYAINVLLFVGQRVKFATMEKTKLYVLSPFLKQDIKDVQCSICLVSCTSSDKIVQLPCFSEHLFHYTCMRNWFMERKQCPLCRFDLQMYSIQ